MIFDKTGTLTIGKPVVVNTQLFKNIPLQQFYDAVASVEVSNIPKKL
jgi:Cu+-exporting ATPase